MTFIDPLLLRSTHIRSMSCTFSFIQQLLQACCPRKDLYSFSIGYSTASVNIFKVILYWLEKYCLGKSALGVRNIWGGGLYEKVQSFCPVLLWLHILSLFFLKQQDHICYILVSVHHMGVPEPFLKHLIFATFMNNLECQYLKHTLK